MRIPTVVLVLASAMLHAHWNYLLKREGGDQLVVGLSKVAEAAALAPVVLGSLVLSPGAAVPLLVVAAVGAALVGTNYICLSAAYNAADLSSAYPIARGGILLLLPVAGLIVFGERVDTRGVAGLLLITTGIGLQLVRAPRTGHRGAALAFAAAGAATAYTLWDKHAVQTLPPAVYFSAYSLLVGAGYAVFIRTSYGIPVARTCWRTHRTALVQIALANSAGYLLMLYALRGGISSYVIGLRQSSIVFGALAGSLFLGERPSGVAWTGIGLIAAGCAFVVLG